MPKHYAVVVGARPNFIKAAPLIKTLKERDVHVTLIHTGQHYNDNMSGVFFQQLDMPVPDVHLGGSDMFAELRQYFSTHTFDGVIVFGDVDSTLAGAVGAFVNGQAVFHVESGLRSFDQTMPEERNRKVIDHMSTLHFVSEPSAMRNLHYEGIRGIEVGNLMIESLELFSHDIEHSNVLERLALPAGEYVVVTIHRHENLESKRLRRLMRLIGRLSKKANLVFPMHPGTQKRIEEEELGHYLDKVYCIQPLGYFDFIKLVKESNGVVTDSGGIQEETTHLGIPCCTLRNNTERPITITQGSNRLFTDGEEDIEEMLVHLSTTFDDKPILLWDNKVSQRIYENLCRYTDHSS